MTSRECCRDVELSSSLLWFSKMAVNYLTAEHLVGLENYKYSAVDTNPLSVYVMHPFWNRLVKLCPRWLAPNVLTFVGFLLIVINFTLLSYYDYDFNASNTYRTEYFPIPKWVWLFCAISHFVAYTLDGIDGKQARRTNSSGPLGEMFDHGLDSWATLFIPCCLYDVFGRDDYSISVIEFYICMWVIQFTFLSSHWEKYNTGVLYLPWSYDISEILCFFLFVVTYLEDYTLWKFTFPVWNIPFGICVKYLLLFGSFGLSLPVSLYNIYISYAKCTGKMRGLYEANRPLISSFIFMLLCYLWIQYSPNNVIHLDPRCFYVMTGTVVSHICCRLIVSQMTNTRCELINWLLAPVSAVMTFSLMATSNAPGTEVFMLRLLTGSVILAHVHYGVCVVRQMCDHFNIHCFKLKEQQD